MTMPAPVSDRPISKSQIKQIHVMLTRLGIDDDTYREKLRLMFDVDSCKGLTRKQASTLLTSLGRPMQAARPHPPAKPAAARKADNVTQLVTDEQRRLIDELCGEIAWHVEDGFMAWLKANQGIERIRTSVEASRAIRGLLALKRHQEKQQTHKQEITL